LANSFELQLSNFAPTSHRRSEIVESKAALFLNINHHTFRYRKKKLQIKPVDVIFGCMP